MIIDFNAHFGAGPGAIERRSARACYEMQRAAGIDLCVASDLATAFDDFDFEQGPLPPNIILFAGLSPRFNASSLPTAKGVRIYPTYQQWRFDDAESARPLAQCRERRMIVQIYLRLQDPRALPVSVAIGEVIKQAHKLIQANADVRFVISGASYAEVRQNVDLFGRSNVWTDISHIQHPINSLPKLVELIDSSRVLFGSGAPVMYPYANLYRVINSSISPAARERILWRNAAELLGITP